MARIWGNLWKIWKTFQKSIRTVDDLSTFFFLSLFCLNKRRSGKALKCRKRLRAQWGISVVKILKAVHTSNQSFFRGSKEFMNWWVITNSVGNNYWQQLFSWKVFFQLSHTLNAAERSPRNTVVVQVAKSQNEVRCPPQVLGELINIFLPESLLTILL
jgi:hypothetical protein